MYTPGPWRADTFAVYGPRGTLDHVAHCGGSSYLSDVQIANARLIAAAPELLAACRKAYQHLESVDDAGAEAERLLGAALIKATHGESERKSNGK